MKLTKSNLQQIIKEEVNKLNEASVQTLLGLPAMGKIESSDLIAAVTEKINSGEIKNWESNVLLDLRKFIDNRVRDEPHEELRSSLKKIRIELERALGVGEKDPEWRSRRREFYRQKAGEEESDSGGGFSDSGGGFSDFYSSSGRLSEKNTTKLTKAELQKTIQEEIAALAEKKKKKADDKWIQGAEKDIEKRGTEGVCTGDKFGGPTCKPGTKRYNLAKTFRKMGKNKKKKKD